MKKLFILVMMLFLVISCGKPASQKAFESYMSDIKSVDKNKAKELISSSDSPAVQKFGNFYVNFFKKIEYKVLSVEEQGNESVLQVEIKAPNVLEPFVGIVKEGIGLAFSGTSEEDMDKFFNDSMDNILESKDLNYMTGTIPVYMVKTDGDWEINTEKSSDLFVYLTGGLSTFVQQ